MTSTSPSVPRERAEAVPPVVRLQDSQIYEAETLLGLALKRLRRDYLTLIAIATLILFVLLALCAPLITHQVLGTSYRRTDVTHAFQKVGAPGHVLGTDDLGRDELARLVYGARVSLGIGVSAAILSLVIGASLGVVAGYYQGGRLGIIDDYRPVHRVA